MNNNYKYDLSYAEKKLPDLFKEIQDIRYGRAKPKEYIEEKKEPEYVPNHKFNAIGVIIGVLFVILFFGSIHSNSIFATTEKEKVPIKEFETNENTIDMMEIISKNISDFTKKEIITEEIEIPYETETIENDLLPKDETNVVQVGNVGTLSRTSILTYENNELVNESVINEVVEDEAVKEIIEIGTSEFLADNQVHIGDTMYTTEEVKMFQAPEDEIEMCYVYQYINLEILSEKDGVAKISVDGLEGYIDSSKLTSENKTPGIAEKCRIQRILIELTPEMQLNTPSGLTKEDFIKVLSGNPNDKNKIFEQNAELFYDVEQKYNVNGLFLASIAIHESNWGTSNIANEKKNLFGYGSYDSSAYSSSYTFDSYEIGIETLAKVLAKYYLNEAGTQIYDNETAVGSYYNGATVAGVNKRYASDPNWCEKVYKTMVSLYEKL